MTKNKALYAWFNEFMPFYRTVNVLGTQWIVDRLSVESDTGLNDADGFSDWTTKRIVVRDEKDIAGALRLPH